MFFRLISIYLQTNMASQKKHTVELIMTKTNSRNFEKKQQKLEENRERGGPKGRPSQPGNNFHFPIIYSTEFSILLDEFNSLPRHPHYEICILCYIEEFLMEFFSIIFLTVLTLFSCLNSFCNRFYIILQVKISNFKS